MNGKRNSLLLIIGIFLVCITAVICNTITIIPNDEVFDKLIKEVLQKFAVAVYVAVVFCLMKIPFCNRGFLWALPLFVTAIVNFPFTALIFGKANVDRADLIWLFVISCLLTAIAEELFFRGILLDYFSKRFAGRFVILKSCLISSAVFGLWHLTNLFYGSGLLITLGQVVYTFLLGIMLSVAVIKTGNRLITILIHFIFNVGGRLIPTLGSGSTDLPFIILTVIFGIVTGVYILITYMKLEGTREGLFKKNSR